ncbi:hypothetical protein [Streptomyces adustus]|uniref:hypothetical protein n=1 Tax=Streptomyces adustus TaxID=1609272 RepID=UPI00371E55D5
MAETQNPQDRQDPQIPHQWSGGLRSGPLRRFLAAVVGAAALVALSVGVALAAGSDDESGPVPYPSSTSPAAGDSGGSVGVSSVDGGGDSTSDGSTGGVSGGTAEGTIGGGAVTPSPTSTDDTPVSPEPGTSGEPTAPSDLAELDRRITELDRKVDQLPTKRELADALRAFADELDRAAGPTEPAR